MVDSIRFSIVVPTRNRPEPLAHCLNALAQLNYSRDRFEIIVVDDGSWTALGEFQCAMPITLLRQAHAGPAAARNAGAAHACGTFLAFTDDDCAPDPNWLRALEARLDAMPGCAVGGKTVNGLTDNISATASQLLIDYLYAYYNRDPNRAAFVASNNLAAPRARFIEMGGFDASFPRAAAEDRDFCDRWLARGNALVYAADAVVCHAHALSLKSFVRQHWSYGRGARHFRRARARRGHAHLSIEPLRFYRDLVLHPFARRTPRAGLLSFLLLLTQVANAAGFFREAWNVDRK
ncbi:MAG: glycosyltransferase [Chloroflexi bacterium]|nr:glycosyltransferase [Chloroflexota bacterium]